MYKSKRVKLIIRVFSLTAALAIMGVIFFFSSQNGTSSDKLSISLTSLLLAKEWDSAAILNSLVRKIAHVTEYAVLSVPVYFFFSTFKITVPARCAASFGITALYAVTDEIHQLFVEGRTCLVSDMLLDSFGALVTVYLLNLIVSRVLRGKNGAGSENPAAADAVFEAARAFMCGEKTAVPGIDDSNFEEFVLKLREHKLLPVASFVLNDDARISENNRRLLQDEAFAQIISQENGNSAFLKAYKALTEAGAKPIAVKGCVCASLWSEPSLRISGDADILAKDGDFETCRRVLESLGYKPSGHDPSNEICFSNPKGCRIELHSSPFKEDASFSKLNSAVGDMSEMASTVNIDGVEIICPGVQDHFVYLVLHAFKHFVNSGVGIRQLMDICLLSKDESIDWNTVFEKCSGVSADGFLSAVLLISAEYFGLDISRINSPLFRKDVDCEIMLKDIKSGGIYGTRNTDKHHSGSLTVNSYAESQNGERNAVIFLPAGRMKRRYPYLRRYPFLLPLAWLQRVFGYVFSDHDAAETFASGKSRIKIMKYYGIIK